MSSFFMVSIARVVLAAFAPSGSVTNDSSTSGTTCQERPYLSFTQPQGPSSPPSVRAPQ
ncbi:hypothetical protein EES42_02565 [Streptomyces sp. ADI95-17]|nr:hypothetical protein EES42_02565 [Streptomyces sp. ADI95-17]